MADQLEPEYESSNEKLHLIGDYINGNMNSDERATFEGQLERDPELAEEYQLQLEIAETVKRLEREEMKSRLSQLIEKDYSKGALIGEPGADHVFNRTASSQSWINPEFQPSRKRRQMSFAIAAILAIALVGSSLLYIYLDQTTTSEQNQIADGPRPLDPHSPGTSEKNHTKEPSSSSNPNTNTRPNTKTNSIPETSSNTLLAARAIVIDNFTFSPKSFGFANGNRSLKIVYYSFSEDNTRSRPGDYKLNADTLQLYIGNSAQVRIFELTNTQLDDADIELSAGVYMLYDTIIYLLINDGSLHPLTPLDKTIQDYLIKYI
jgi:hypothetical protein